MKRSWIFLFTLGLIVVLSSSVLFAQEPVLIKIWDQFGYEGSTAAGPAMDKLVDAYLKANPNVKIERTYVSQSKIRDQVRLAFSAGTAPDAIYTWPAAAVLSGYAKDGKLFDLSADAKTLGWLDRLPDLEIKRCSYGGKLYAYPSEEDLMVVYYNRDLFDKLGLKEPATYDDFLKICETLKSNGYVPIAFGNRDKWPATNTLSYLLALTAGKANQEGVLFKDTPWNNPNYLEACNIFMDWVNKKYFPDGFNGIDYGEANTLFSMGKAGMNITGTWIIQDMAAIENFKIDAFLLPQIKTDVPRATMTGEGSQWEVNAASDPKVLQEVVKFLNYLYTDENLKTWIEEGYLIPIRKGGINLDEYTIPDLVKKAYTVGNSMEEVNGYDLHTTVPESVVETLYNSLQSMLSGSVSPEDFLKEIDTVWAKAKEAKEVWVP